MHNYSSNGITVASFIDNRRATISGSYPVKIRVTYKRERKYYSTGKELTLDEWEQLPVIKAFARYDFTIFARGDSMYPEYHSGDELACVFIRDSKFIQWGRVHVLDTSQGIILKRIFKGDNCIICKSDNPNYPEFNIEDSELYNIALVIGMIRRY